VAKGIEREREGRGPVEREDVAATRVVRVARAVVLARKREE